MRFLISLQRIFWLLALTCFYDSLVAEDFSATRTLPPMEQSMMMLDSIEASPIEGIWEYPGESVKVMILKGNGIDSNRYDIKVLEAFTCELNTDDLLGWISPTAEKNKFELHQYTRRKNSILDLPGKCFVTLSKDASTLLISEAKKISFTIRPLSILPKFWRIVNITSKGRSKEPAEGLRKLYPADYQQPGRKGKRTL